MLIIPPTEFRNRRGRPLRKPPAAMPAPPAALTLVSATYEDAVSVSLTFDRPIDIAALAGAQITLDDGAATALLYDGTGGAMLTDPQTVRIGLNEIGASVGLGTQLSASAASGIVAVDDGGTWGGVSDVELPFP